MSSSEGHGLGADKDPIPGRTEIRLRQIGNKDSWVDIRADLNLGGGLGERVLSRRG